MAILTRGFGLFSPESLAYAPVQPVQISTADNDAIVKKTASRKLPRLKATHRIKRYPITAVSICTKFLLRNPGGGRRAWIPGMLPLVCGMVVFFSPGLWKDAGLNLRSLSYMVQAPYLLSAWNFRNIRIRLFSAPGQASGMLRNRGILFSLFSWQVTIFNRCLQRPISSSGGRFSFYQRLYPGRESEYASNC